MKLYFNLSTEAIFSFLITHFKIKKYYYHFNFYYVIFFIYFIFILTALLSIDKNTHVIIFKFICFLGQQGDIHKWAELSRWGTGA